MYHVILSYTTPQGVARQTENQVETPEAAIALMTELQGCNLVTVDRLELVSHPELKTPVVSQVPGGTHYEILKGISPVLYYWTGSDWTRKISEGRVYPFRSLADKVRATEVTG